MKPKLDDRFGSQDVSSRAGLSKRADMLLSDDTVLDPELLKGKDCILVDEAQFLSKSVIDQFRTIATVQNIPIICYGLRTDFRGTLFEGSKRLFEVSDSLEEIKTTCAFCNRKAIFNLKLIDGKASLTGPTIELGAEEKYLPACSKCYRLQIEQQYVATV